MGCDIHGLVEVNWYGKYEEQYEEDPVDWLCAIDNVGMWVGRSYDLFGMLFGVRNYANFDPIAPKRGIPEEGSERLEDRLDYFRNHEAGNLIGAVDCHSHTYLTLKELNEINWEETTEKEDSRIRVYDEEDELQMKAARIGSLSDDEVQRIEDGEEVVKENSDGEIRKYRREKMKKEEALSGAWEKLIEQMEMFGETYGEENVRLVVWFDN